MSLLRLFLTNFYLKYLDSNHNIPNHSNDTPASSSTSFSNSSNQNASSSQPRSSTLNTENATNTTTTNSSRLNTTPPPPAPPTNSQNVKRRASLSDLNSEYEVESLTIKQIKEILASNFVEYRGCCEKQELIDKVKRLYKSNRENKRIEQELNENTNSSNHYQTSSSGNKRPNDAYANGEYESNLNGTSPNAASENKQKRADESDLCKICMESLIDCVLLDWGHMCSCIK